MGDIDVVVTIQRRVLPEAQLHALEEKEQASELMISVTSAKTVNHWCHQTAYCCHFPQNAAAWLGDNNDQSGDPGAAAAAWNCVTSSQVIEFTEALGDTMISRVTSKNSPHKRPAVFLSSWAEECAPLRSA